MTKTQRDIQEAYWNARSTHIRNANAYSRGEINFSTVQASADKLQNLKAHWIVAKEQVRLFGSTF